MSALHKVIRLQSLIKTLNDNEITQFTMLFFKKCGREALLNPFCNQYIQANVVNADTSHLDAAMGIIKNIIRTRCTYASNKKKSFNQNGIGMELLPSAIIGEIASYLNQKNYASLSKTNRSVYIGCSEPVTLRKLNLNKINDYLSQSEHS